MTLLAPPPKKNATGCVQLSLNSKLLRNTSISTTRLNYFVRNLYPVYCSERTPPAPRPGHPTFSLKKRNTTAVRQRCTKKYERNRDVLKLYSKTRAYECASKGRRHILLSHFKGRGRYHKIPAEWLPQP